MATALVDRAVPDVSIKASKGGREAELRGRSLRLSEEPYADEPLSETEAESAGASPEVILITLPGCSAKKLRALKAALDELEIPGLVLSSQVAISNLNDVASAASGAGIDIRSLNPRPTHPDQLVLDATHQQVTRRGSVIQLSRNEFRLLAVLAKRSGEPISSRELSEQAFGEDNQKSDHYLRMYVRLLRKRIEPDPANPRYLLTDRRTKGYRLSASVAFIH